MDSQYSQLKKIAYFSLILLIMGNLIQGKNATGKLYEGMPAPSFTLSDLNGKSKTLSHLSAGKKLIAIVFWTMWNEQSSKELKRFQKSYEQYQSRGFQVIAINVEGLTISKKQLKKITSYCEKTGITFPVLIDQNLDTFNKYSIIAIPTTCLINDKETVVYKLPGYPIVGAEQLFSFIKEIMESEHEKVSLEHAKFRMPKEKALRYYQMAKVLQKNGDLPGAVESLRKSINIDPDFLAPYNRLGALLYEEGKQKEAIELFNKVLSRNPGDIAFLADYGNFLLQTGNAGKGLEMIRKVIKEDPNYSVGHYYLGIYLLKQGKKDGALREARMAVKLNPLDSNGHRLLGSIYESMGKKKKSLASYKKAARLLEKKVKSKDFPFLSLVFTPDSP